MYIYKIHEFFSFPIIAFKAGTAKCSFIDLTSSGDREGAGIPDL